jgi:hypothetical protein
VLRPGREWTKVTTLYLDYALGMIGGEPPVEVAGYSFDYVDASLDAHCP